MTDNRRTIRCHDTLWEAAQQAARSRGTDVSSLIRAALQRITAGPPVESVKVSEVSPPTELEPGTAALYAWLTRATPSYESNGTKVPQAWHDAMESEAYRGWLNSQA